MVRVLDTTVKLCFKIDKLSTSICDSDIGAYKFVSYIITSFTHAMPR